MPTIDLGKVVPSINGKEAVNGNVDLTHTDVDAVAQPETENDSFTDGSLSPWVNYKEELSSLKQQIVDYRTALNLLENSDWRIKKNIVNQRGQEIYNVNGTGAYTIDRWYQWGTSVALNDGYLTIVGGAFCQKVLKSKIHADSVTFALYGKNGNVSVFATRLPVNGETLASGILEIIGYNDMIAVVVPEGDWKCSGLYEGTFTAETLPPYVSKEYAAELIECYRYFYSMKNYALALTKGNTEWVSASYHFPVPMRAHPSVLNAEVRIDDRDDKGTLVEGCQLYADENGVISMWDSAGSFGTTENRRIYYKADFSADL